MAFPSGERTKLDKDFLDPFVPADFQPSSRDGCDGAGRADKPRPHAPNEQHPHLVRDARDGFLFRIDPVPWSSPSRHVITVQSTTRPDWGYAFHNAPEFLDVPEYAGENPKVVSFSPDFRKGEHLRFRLRANPTKRSPFPPEAWLEKAGNNRAKGKRVGLISEEEQRKWLERRAVPAGFRLAAFDARSEGLTRHGKPDPQGRGTAQGWKQTMLAVLFEGILEVTDPIAFAATASAGIGTGKAFGFGLLSLARA